MEKTIVLTGGGTAGHVTPNLAVMPKLCAMGYRLEYIGTKNGMEREIIEKAGVPYHIISAGKLRRYFSFKNVTDPFRIIAGFVKARRILKGIRPYAVFSKGGFVSVPVVVAASRLGIPVVLHESDYTPGLANRICIPRAEKVCVSFKPTLTHIPDGKGVCTGLPIREELLRGSREKGLAHCGLTGEKPVLLIMGGSLGAKSVNEMLDIVMGRLLQTFDVIHIRGKKHLRSGRQPDGYKQFGFVCEELPDIYAAADVMISRAGATAVFEILALAMPALLIPLPKSASRGDQILNANCFKEQGFAHMLEQENMTEDILLDAVRKLYKDRDVLRERMKQEKAADAAGCVAKVIDEVG